MSHLSYYCLYIFENGVKTCAKYYHQFYLPHKKNCLPITVARDSCDLKKYWLVRPPVVEVAVEEEVEDATELLLGTPPPLPVLFFDDFCSLSVDGGVVILMSAATKVLKFERCAKPHDLLLIQ